ncbi:hypothetical protein [Chromobacterium sp. CV08]|uniref:hypothetical protein n=1 Tax=Chromobacterium sp. CV08 TaxID=3133274 RepID=UPI003DAA22AD
MPNKKNALMAVLACSLFMLNGCENEGGTGNHLGTPTSPAAGTYTPGGNIATVAGIDSENRGYRDDVKQLIEDIKPSTPGVKIGAETIARSYQKTVTASVPQDTSTADMQILQEAQAGACAAKYAGAGHLDEMSKITGEIYARTYNTDERMTARLAVINAPNTVAFLSTDSDRCQAMKAGQ